MKSSTLRLTRFTIVGADACAPYRSPPQMWGFRLSDFITSVLSIHHSPLPDAEWHFRWHDGNRLTITLLRPEWTVTPVAPTHRIEGRA